MTGESWTREPDPDFDRPGKAAKGAGRDPKAATDSLGLGAIAMFTWFVPVIGQVFPILGLICGHRGWHAPNHGRARLGVFFSVIALIFGLALIAGIVSSPIIDWAP